MMLVQPASINSPIKLGDDIHLNYHNGPHNSSVAIKSSQSPHVLFNNSEKDT